jgi:biotin-(acetyl-CoA carboxylase) ligase
LANAIVAASQLAESVEGWAALKSKWARLDLAAAAIEVSIGDGTFGAVGEAIDDDGALLVRVGEAVRRVEAGEVSIRSRNREA